MTLFQEQNAMKPWRQADQAVHHVDGHPHNNDRANLVIMDVAENLSEDDRTICLRCGHPRAAHFGLKLNCPLSRTVKPGSRFTSVEN